MENSVIIEHVLFLIIFILFIGMIFGKVASWLKLPDVALFLIAGVVVGQGLHLVNEPSSSFMNQFILTTGSALILFDGGRNIRLSGLRKVWLTVSLLSVPGVLITCAVVAFAAHWLLGIPMMYAVLHVSGFMATFVAGLIWGNHELFKLELDDKLHEMAHFTENMTVVMRMLIFIMLGSQVNFRVILDHL